MNTKVDKLDNENVAKKAGIRVSKTTKEVEKELIKISNSYKSLDRKVTSVVL